MSAATTKAGNGSGRGLGLDGLVDRALPAAQRAMSHFFDSREEPPGLEELEEICPDAKVRLGKARLPRT